MKNHPPSPSEESHPVTDPLGKTVEKTGDKLSTTKSKYNSNKYNMVIFDDNRLANSYQSLSIWRSGKMYALLFKIIMPIAVTVFIVLAVPC